MRGQAAARIQTRHSMMLLHKKAITLTELLVTAVIVVVVMMGAVSIDSNVRKSRDQSSKTSLLYLNTRAMVTHILLNASQAVGYGSTSAATKGILLPADMANNNSFCIDQDVSPTTTNPNNTVTKNGDDRWFCYTFQAPNLFACTKTYDGTKIYRGAGACTAADTNYNQVGTAVSVTPTFTLNRVKGSQQVIFEVTIVSRDNPALPKSITNPEINMTYSTNPPGHSI